MGNYESCRVDIGVEDAPRDKETVDSAFNRIYDYVERKLIEKVSDIEKEIKIAGS